ncbi:MAG: hypothetical protein ABJG78_15855 [Cyclobacteriaceae bacterium]
MTILKKILIGLGIALIAFLTFSVWYTIRFSMTDVISTEVRPDNFKSTVLIATQGSKYKDAMVDSVVHYLKSKPVFVKISDVKGLSSVEPENWDAILIFHTWEMSKPPQSVLEFVEKNYNPEKVFVLSTSFSSEERIDGVDATTGASKMQEVPTHLTTVISFLDDKLDLDQSEKDSLD